MTRPRPDLPVVLLSHRGPVSFERDESGERTASRGAGGLVTALTGLVSDLPDAVWVCAASSEEDAAVAAEAKGQAVEVVLDAEPRLLDQGTSGGEGAPAVRVRLVEVEPQAHDDFYTVIANPLLWFLQHGMYGLALAPVLTKREHAAYEDGYVAVNRLFADAVVEQVPGDPALPGHAQPAQVPLDRAPAGAGLPVGHRLPVLGLRLRRPVGRFRPVVVGVGPGVQVAAVRGGRVAEVVAASSSFPASPGCGSVIAGILGVLGGAAAQEHVADGYDDHARGGEHDEVVDAAAVGQNHAVHAVPVCRHLGPDRRLSASEAGKQVDRRWSAWCQRQLSRGTSGQPRSPSSSMCLPRR